ncbi:uncharacterized protein LOC124449577 isoform X2 [Xenia sp. Carnegie-2017]|uniref:uncharacterized protein LOC124449577 isoform X2 n=1 Tax=Xenia sp. Carnegie-2017 TaxID=2897299 RepID=UPI001F04F9AF|nr:uncharacterized protein LOC124449577 isoform X2 [Xenia sp. Carnegie-2017]
MFKGTFWKAMDERSFRSVSLVSLLFLVSTFKRADSNEVLFLGCFKPNSSDCFNTTAGDYVPSISIDVNKCIGACSDLNQGQKLAGISNGVCVCSRSTDFCGTKVNNAQCSYPASESLYYKVYRVNNLPTLTVPKVVSTFSLFELSMNPLVLNCLYTLDYGDSVTTLPSSFTGKTTHWYATSGNFKITLSSQCLAKSVSTMIKVVEEELSNVSLHCPEILEAYDDSSSCMLTVLKGSNLRVVDLNNANSNYLLPDTVVESIGILKSDSLNKLFVLQEGTYFMPYLSVINDGYIQSVQYGIYTNGTVTVQVWSPRCLSGTKACRGECVPSTEICSGILLTEQQMKSKYCCLKSNVEVNYTEYIVSEEFQVDANINLHVYKLPYPVQVRRGDVIALHFSNITTVSGVDMAGSGLRIFCGQKFKRNQSVKITNATQRFNSSLIWFRVHVMSGVVFQMPIIARKFNVIFNLNVSAVSTFALVSQTILVQERITGLQIFSPLANVYYPTMENLTFSFNVSNGTNVTYIVDFGDDGGLTETSLTQLKHRYHLRGQYALNITAYNMINKVNASHVVAVVVPVKNLTFLQNPAENPGEVGVLYTIRFFLESGDQSRINIKFGNNHSSFFSCGNVTNEIFQANVTYNVSGTYNITITAFGLVERRKLNISSSVKILQRIAGLTLYQVDSNAKIRPIFESGLIENEFFGQRLTLFTNVSAGSDVEYTWEIKTDGETNDDVHKTINGSIMNFTPDTGGLWEVIVTANNDLNNESASVNFTISYNCETAAFYDPSKSFLSTFENEIRNSVNTSSSDIMNLEFDLYPDENPGEVSLPYTVQFFVESGDKSFINIEFGNDKSALFSCGKSTKKIFNATVTYNVTGTYNITITALGLVERRKLHKSSSVKILQRIVNLTLHLDDSNGLIGNDYFGKRLTFFTYVSAGSDVEYTWEIKTDGETNDDVRKTINGSIMNLTPDTGGLWEIIVTANNDLNNESASVNFTISYNCETAAFYDPSKSFLSIFENEIRNSVNISSSDIMNLKFNLSPDENPGEVSLPYTVQFFFVPGDKSFINIEFGNDKSALFSCGKSTTKIFNATVTYNVTGTYNITITAFFLVERRKLRKSSSVKILQRIVNLNLHLDDSNGLIGNDYFGKRLTFSANVNAGSDVDYTWEIKTDGETNDDVHKTINGNIMNFTPDTGGLWEIIVTANNDLNNESASVNFTIPHNCESAIEIYDQREKDEPFVTTYGHDIRINAVEYLRNTSCKKEQKSADCWTYHWSVYEEDKRINLSFPNNSFLFIKKRTFNPGSYRVQVNAFCNETGRRENTSVDKTYIKIEASNPVAIIDGGSRRDVVERSNKLIINASKSYDPDDKTFDSSNLVFRWQCVANCSNISWQNVSSIVTVNVSLLKVGDRFEFSVNVSLREKCTYVTQKIRIVANGSLVTKIICRVNCLARVTLTSRLSLQGQCEACLPTKEIIYKWKLFYKNGSVANVSAVLDRQNLIISAYTLEPKTFYRVELRVKSENLTETLSVYKFETVGHLSGGTCNVSPDKGEAARTEFHVECEKWKSEYPPLTYSVRYIPPFEAKDSEGDQLILWYTGEQQKSSQSQLPAGEKNGSIAIEVEITSALGEYTKLTLHVVVNPVNSTSESLDNVVENINELSEDYPGEITQQIIIYSQVLNHNQDSFKEDPKKIRRAFIKNLKKVETNTLPSIQQTSDALKLAAYDETQVVHDTQVFAAERLQTMSDSFLNISTDRGTQSGDEVDKTGTILLSAVTKILNASLFSGKDTTKENAPDDIKENFYGVLSRKGKSLEKIAEETKKVVERLDKTMQTITKAMASLKLFREQSTNISTPLVDVKISKDFDLKQERIVQKAFSNDNDKRRSPSVSLQKDALPFLSHNGSNDIFLELMSFKENPYISDVRNAYFIQPEVFSIKFRRRNGNEVVLENLSQDIEIILPKSLNASDLFMNRSSEDSNIYICNIRVNEDHFEEQILIEIQIQEEKYKRAQFLVKYGKKVSPKTKDFKYFLWKNASYEDSHIDVVRNVIILRDSTRLKQAKGVVSIGLLPCPDKGDGPTKKPCDLNAETFKAVVQLKSCRFWNNSNWMTKGCRLSNVSNSLQTKCLCNHLTSFSSYIVSPNPLTRFSIDDFKRGYASFVAVSLIFTFYIFLFIWARRADGFDSVKTSICPLQDNSPHHRYRYEIALWTGMRRNAGTKSKVTVILSGDEGDTRPRCLTNPQNPMFHRGSLEKFLLRTSQDLGDLYCIRIWHDNSHGSWFLSRVMVTDLQNNKRYYFICDRWFAVDEDDGQIERLLPVASQEELIDFYRLFYSKTKRGLNDTHLWFSVLNRPPQSKFTRVQRLSCCVCLIMTSMVVSAMFYDREGEPTPDSTNYIGSYSFTWTEMYVGIVSALIVVPINLIILNIFRNVRPKVLNSKTSIESGEIVPNRESFETTGTPGSFKAISPENSYDSSLHQFKTGLLKEESNNLSCWARFKNIFPSSYPHWFVYVGWAILVVVTLGSATVIILYGMQFGNGKSLKWLLSIFISIFQDIFVTQPLKVLIFALGFALIVKKPDEGEFESNSYHEKEDDKTPEDTLKFNDNDSSKTTFQIESERPIKAGLHGSSSLPSRPSDHQLAIMRKAKMKERKMFFLLQEITVHLIFTVIVVLVTYGHKDTRSFQLYQQIDKLSSKTNKVHNIREFWNWTRNILLPKAFPEKLYNDEYVPRAGFMIDGYNNIISRARLRLLRVKNESCQVPDDMKRTIDVCFEHYSIFHQDENCYKKNWRKVRGDIDSSWCFKNRKKLHGYPTWGTFETYAGSGFVKRLIPGRDINSTFNELEEDDWLDRQTRAVFIEMTTYNANVNLYTVISLLFEFPELGGVHYRRLIVPVRLKLYVGGFAFFVFACEIIFTLFILAYTYQAIRKCYRKRLGYFLNFWNIIDFLVLISSCAAIAVYIYRIHLTTDLMRQVKQRQGHFVNFQSVTFWNELLNIFFAIVVTLVTVKLTKLLRFNIRVSLFTQTLQASKPALAGYFLQFGIVFFAYVIVGVLVFGYDVYQFRNIPSSMLSLGRVILGKNQFMELIHTDRFLGPLFFFTFVLFVSWILMTMFVAIINDSYHDVRDKTYGKSNDYEVVDFFLAWLKSWSGFGLKKKTPANSRWRQIGRKEKYLFTEDDILLEKTADLMKKFELSVKSLEQLTERWSKDHFAEIMK